MQSDAEIFDALGIPEDRRQEVALALHGWSRHAIPGPNMYAVMACIIWNYIRINPFPIPNDTFDVSKWLPV